jgi:hypothetical protein
MPMPRKPRPLDRASAERDASLIVIASEDTYAVEQYFRRFNVRRVQFKVLPTEDGRSSPEDVLVRLDEYKREYDIGEGDTLWLCTDTDHWAKPNHIGNLVRVLQECRQKEYGIAISNPCFELWLLLHFEDAAGLQAGISCEEVTRMLKKCRGGYTKGCCERLPLTGPGVEDAIGRARKMDADPSKDLPETPGTRVYRIVEALKQRDAIDLS